HFFSPIKHLSESDRKYLRLITVKPLLPNEMSEERFWKKSCRLPLKQIQYEDLPVRKSFKVYSDKLRKEEPFAVKIEVQDPHELHLLQNALKFGDAEFTAMSHSITYQIKPSDKVAILMMGADPHLQS